MTPLEELGVEMIIEHSRWDIEAIGRIKAQFDSMDSDEALIWSRMTAAIELKLSDRPEECYELMADIADDFNGVSAIGEAMCRREIIRFRIRFDLRDGDLDEIIRYRSVVSSINAPLVESLFALTEGNIYEKLNDVPKSLITYQNALSMIENEPATRGTVEIILSLAHIYFNIGNLEDASKLADRAIADTEALKDERELAKALSSKARVLVFTSKYAECIEVSNRALDLAIRTGARGDERDIYQALGMVYAHIGDTEAATQQFMKSLAIAEEENNHLQVINIRGNIGVMHFLAEDHDRGLREIETALDMYRETDEDPFRLHLHRIRVRALFGLGRIEEAVEALDQISEHAEESVGLAWIDYQITFCEKEFHTGKLEEAKQRAYDVLSSDTDFREGDRFLYLYQILRNIAQQENDLASYVKYNDLYSSHKNEKASKQAASRLAVIDREREIERLEQEHKRERAVLHSTLPKNIADRVAAGETVNDSHDNAAVIFLDIVGFTTLSDKIPSGHVVHLLEQIFTTLDAVTKRHNVVKIKTIGDSYMAVAFDDPATAAPCSLEMISALDALQITMPPELGDTAWTKDIDDIKVRIGIHSGPVTAGVIGTERMQYDVWGDTVNVASRMESSGEPGKVHVSEAFAAVISSGVRERGPIEVKGKGLMTTYWLEGA